MPDLKKIPKPVILLAVVAGGGALIYAHYRKKTQAATAAASGDGSSTDASGTADTSGQYDSGAYMGYQPYGTGYGPYGLADYGDQSGAYGGGGYYGVGAPYQVPTQATTNAQWVQAALTVLTQSGGYDTSTVLTALGLYTTGQPLTASQEQVVTSAIAAEGYPPVEGPGGFPPAMKSTTVNTGGSSGNVSVPNVVGQEFGPAYNTITRAGLISQPGKNGVNATWKVTAQSPKAGASVSKGTIVKLTVPKPKK